MEFRGNDVLNGFTSVVGYLVIPINASAVQPICEPYLLGQVKDCFAQKALWVQTCQTTPTIAKMAFLTAFAMFVTMLLLKQRRKDKK